MDPQSLFINFQPTPGYFPPFNPMNNGYANQAQPQITTLALGEEGQGPVDPYQPGNRYQPMAPRFLGPPVQGGYGSGQGNSFLPQVIQLVIQLIQIVRQSLGNRSASW